MLGPEKICPKLTTDINWHFQRDILSTASHRNLTIEVISFTGILYQVAIIRRNLAQKIVEASRVIFPQADIKITCVVDYPHDDYGFWRYPTV